MPSTELESVPVLHGGDFKSPLSTNSNMKAYLKGSYQVSHTYQGATLILQSLFYTYLSSNPVLPQERFYLFQLNSHPDSLIELIYVITMSETLTTLIELHFIILS